jgi:ribosomal protein L30E
MMEVKSEIRAAIEKKKIAIGLDSVIDGIRKKKLSKIVVAKNAPEEIKERLFFYSELGNVPVDVFSEDNTQLGILCKRSFGISVLGIIK